MYEPGDVKPNNAFQTVRGVAAVEAAIIAPVAVALLGLVAIWAQGIAIQHRVTLTDRTAAICRGEGGGDMIAASVDQVPSLRHRGEQSGERLSQVGADRRVVEQAGRRAGLQGRTDVGLDRRNV